MHSTTTTTWSVRPVEPQDEAPWRALYRGYRTFYRLDHDDAVVDRTWQWIVRGDHGLFGLVASRPDGTLGALADLRWFARPSSATLGLYLDDLFTAAEHRGLGLGRMLLDRARSVAADGGASVVRWITAADNATARSLYDAHATATPWITYDMAPGAAR
ncbi:MULTISPECIES: GNAT family N-acetyltransferase [unclassified Curtobacterium]|uniref:GNAT family N-acetyltransferase n=1 Tax=unclassified Curtobacterium TaxID=257496 RepID=UPI000DAA861F|nr:MULTISPECIES: GNAT family N-acetyltransferase [unclassified Curtobacterium]PZE24769.1 GNAT family N-acetyltransferase [Curtobacterium sp. MCBD17_028]PZE73847.1 GNAT family N-acetyltransferase [Curtobacterium sp. MCBD17_019]PZF56643.1 GNAT family N-acetyltransferase [Curtobacterium sp. MCBD17_034]PZF60482.1 GNAT family N-acetyltransferase [Curtobacterium sp. MCBD17_013]PZM33324.1 GNAT family N-acetyltransferase [Curtobacterium sp. MCBD17_031]